MPERRTILIHVSGIDRPGITSGLLSILADQEARVLDMEQFVVMGRLTLDVVVSIDEERAAFRDLLFFGWEQGIEIEFEETSPPTAELPSLRRHAVTVIASHLPPVALAAIAEAIAGAGGNIERIRRLANDPVASYELIVAGADDQDLRRRLGAAAMDHGIDVAVQPEALERRAKRLVVIDVDSTLIRDEVIDLLAEEAGKADEVTELTRRAMIGELDFSAALQQRVALLEGLDADAIERVVDRLRLTPGARRFVRTLRRLGFSTAIVSGGFRRITDTLRERLGFDHAFANELEIVDGRLTGRLCGEVVDRRRKAELLIHVAEMENVPLEQTVAIGDGANDLDMLAAAGLGIAFNAKRSVTEVADTAVSVPYLDAILFLLGIGADEIERDRPTGAGS